MADRENFIRRIAIEKDFYPEFFFNRVNTATGKRYYISVLDNDGRNYLFTMDEKGSAWEITKSSRVPGWIMAIKKKLEDAIFENTIR